MISDDVTETFVNNLKPRCYNELLSGFGLELFCKKFKI